MRELCVSEKVSTATGHAGEFTITVNTQFDRLATGIARRGINPFLSAETLLPRRGRAMKKHFAPIRRPRRRLISHIIHLTRQEHVRYDVNILFDAILYSVKSRGDRLNPVTDRSLEYNTVSAVFKSTEICQIPYASRRRRQRGRSPTTAR